MFKEQQEQFHQIITNEARVRQTDKNTMMDRLLIDPPLLSSAFNVLLEQGVTLEEIRDQLLLNGALISPHYEF